MRSQCSTFGLDFPSYFTLFQETHALRALVGVVLSLDPEGKENGSWWHSTSELVLNVRDIVIL